MKKIFIFISLLMLFSITAQAKDCLDIPFLQQIPTDSQEYLPQGIALCIHQKQCKQVRNLMDKLKKQDQVKYSYLLGSALANGDCYKQNLKEAERLLGYASQYSDAGKRNLLRFYRHYSSDYQKNKEFALSLAEKGFLDAYTFLADSYLQKTTLENYAIAYFWGKVAFIQAEKKYIAQCNQNKKLPENMKVDTSLSAQLAMDLGNLLKPLQSQFSDKVIKKIDILADKFISSIERNHLNSTDPLLSTENIYGVLGAPIAPNFDESPKLKKASPPIDGLSDRIKIYEKEIQALLL